MGVTRVLEHQLDEVLFVSDERARLLEEAQQVVGEGPAVDALRIGGPVFRPARIDGRQDTVWDPLAEQLWPETVGSVCSSPVQFGAVVLAVVTVSAPGAVTSSAAIVREVLVTAEGIGQAMLVGDASATPSAISPLVEPLRMVVHQATGMVSVQMGVPLREALLALRAAAFASSVSLTNIARQVVRGERSFDELDLPPSQAPQPPSPDGDDSP